MQATILPFNTQSQNGRVYPLEAFVRDGGRLLAELNGTAVRGRLGYPDGELLEADVSHHVSHFAIEDGCLVGEVEILNTPAGDKLREILDSVVFSPRSIGYVHNGGLVTIDRIDCVCAIPKADDAFLPTPATEGA